MASNHPCKYSALFANLWEVISAGADAFQRRRHNRGVRGAFSMKAAAA